MKIYLVTNVARQQDGEYVLVKIEKAYKSKKAADAYVAGKPVVETVVLEGFNCLVERGVIEAELE